MGYKFYVVDKDVKEVSFYAKHSKILEEQINRWYEENKDKGYEIVFRSNKIDIDSQNNPHFWTTMVYKKTKDAKKKSKKSSKN